MPDFIEDYKRYELPEIGPEGILPLVSFLQNPIREDAMAVCDIYNDDVEGDRRIADKNLILNKKLFIHDYICWVEGFIKMKGASDTILKNYVSDRKKLIQRNFIKAAITSYCQRYHLYFFLKKMALICKFRY